MKIFLNLIIEKLWDCNAAGTVFGLGVLDDLRTFNNSKVFGYIQMEIWKKITRGESQ